jgi:hypothetical protein
MLNNHPRHVQRSKQTDDQADGQADAKTFQLVVANDVKDDGGKDAWSGGYRGW